MSRAGAVGLLMACIAACSVATTEPATTGAHTTGSRTFAVYAVWLEDAGVEQRPDIDLFLSCLLERSNFETYFQGEAHLTSMGSFVVPSPGTLLTSAAAQTSWLAQTAPALPRPPSGAEPVYVVFGAASVVGAACGMANNVMLDGAKVAMPFVRTVPPCWGGLGPLRSETASVHHELVESIDGVLGHALCAADGACETGEACGGNAACEVFTGLYCDGAPAQSYTGCDPTPVRGWVVQKVSHAARDQHTDTCQRCQRCDFETTLAP